jgi:cytochrome c oxidase subunit II
MFTQLGCAGCHTLAAANATGTVGPDLDDALPGQTEAQVETSIRDPQQKISASPFPPNGVMPPFDEVRLPDADLKTLVQYLLQNAGQSP